MNRKKSIELTEEMQNKIISVAYGDASLSDKMRVLWAASQSGEIRYLLNSYKKTCSEVRALGEEDMPHELLKSIRIKNPEAATRRGSFFYDLISIVLRRPVISAAMSVILIAAMVTSLIINKPVQRTYTTGEIASAEIQAKYALSVVGNIFKETNSTLQNEILKKAVAKPLRQSFGIVNNLLEGDKKNETN